MDFNLRGVVGFPLAPFDDDLQLDAGVLEGLVEEIASLPFCAINAPAGISEIFSLSVDEAVAMLRVTRSVVGGRMPVIGCAYGPWASAREMARRMEEAGADALLVPPPPYADAPFDGVVAYYRSVAGATGLPLILYSRGWANFSPDEVARLAEALPTLRYWKDGQGDPTRYRRIMSRVGDRLHWIGGAGDDRAAAYAAVGVHCFTSSISGVAPRLALEWGEAALEPDFGRLRSLLARFVDPLFALRGRRRGYDVTVMKKARELLGRPVGRPRPPLPLLSPSAESELREVLKSWNPYG